MRKRFKICKVDIGCVAYTDEYVKSLEKKIEEMRSQKK